MAKVTKKVTKKRVKKNVERGQAHICLLYTSALRKVAPYVKVEEV